MKKIYILVILAAILASCKDFSVSSYIRGDALAEVGDAKLYLDDVRNIFTPGIASDDSVKLLANYVDVWVKKQLKIQLAEEKFSEHDGTDIEKMVEDYRISLLIHKFESDFIKENLDTTITADEMSEYYTENPKEFVLSSTMLKAIIVKVPRSLRQQNSMRAMAKKADAQSIQDLIDISIKHNLEYREFSEWVDYAEILTIIPRLGKSTYQDIQTSKGFFEFTDGDFIYFLISTDILKEGSTKPMEMNYDQIKIMVLNKRKQDIVKAMEDTLYNSALRNKTITIN